MKGMKLLYNPTGAAGEYGDIALNIFDGCPHACEYCYVPLVLKKERSTFHKVCDIRRESFTFFHLLRKDLEKIRNFGKSIFLCFTCDPFPYRRHDLCKLTIEVIKMIKEHGNHVTVLTKGEVDEDQFNIFDKDDTFGTTISCDDYMAKKVEPNAYLPSQRLVQLSRIKIATGCKTFVSCEPVYQPELIYNIITRNNMVDEFRIGKLNYVKNDTDWAAFGKKAEYLCQLHNRGYMIKEGLRREMDNGK